jgi:hypothetical protein
MSAFRSGSFSSASLVSDLPLIDHFVIQLIDVDIVDGALIAK